MQVRWNVTNKFEDNRRGRWIPRLARRSRQVRKDSHGTLASVAMFPTKTMFLHSSYYCVLIGFRSPKRCTLRHTSSSFVRRGNDFLMYRSFDKDTSVERLHGVLT